MHEAASKAEFSSLDRVYVNMEGGTTTAVQGALVQLKCERREAELLRAEALASAGEVADVKAASTFDAENSDPAANIGDLTMTALAFDRQRRLKQLRSVMGGVEGIEECVLLSRIETSRCEIHRPLRGSWPCGRVQKCAEQASCTEFPTRCKSIVKATRAVDTRTFNCIGETSANMK